MKGFIALMSWPELGNGSNAFIGQIGLISRVLLQGGTRNRSKSRVRIEIESNDAWPKGCTGRRDLRPALSRGAARCTVRHPGDSDDDLGSGGCTRHPILVTIDNAGTRPKLGRAGSCSRYCPRAPADQITQHPASLYAGADMNELLVELGGTSPLFPIARSTEGLKVGDVVRTTTLDRDNVVDLQVRYAPTLTTRIVITGEHERRNLVSEFGEGLPNLYRVVRDGASWQLAQDEGGHAHFTRGS